VALVSLWALFAAAAVGVGFAAAGLVGDPFTTSGTGSVQAVPGASVSGPDPSTPAAKPSIAPTDTAPTGDQLTRTLSTRGGFVSATCGGGLLRLSASPAVGWGIHDLRSGEGREGRVRFDRAEHGDDRVEVQATCADGAPRFAIEDDGSTSDGSHGGGED
jgi:hypothetical protein